MVAGSDTAEVRRFSPRHVAFILPLILLHLGCGLVLFVGLSKVAAAAFLITSALQVFGITTGYHRLLAHRSFKTTRTFQFVLSLLGVLAGQNGPLWWVGHHRHHHRHSDRDADVHSPHGGFFWSHMGWLFSPRCVPVRHELVRDLERCPELWLLQRYYYVFNLAYALLLYGVGEAWRCFDPLAGTSGFQLLVWGGVVSTVCVYHSIWSANSFCHRYGTRRFATRDDSRNNIVVSLLTFGDGWHHNHHYCPYSARHGFRWWEVDINFIILRLLACLGIVWDLKLPPERVFANVQPQ
jgi:stearoyl-CoA desaturase (Delta-9 desaturase)